MKRTYYVQSFDLFQYFSRLNSVSVFFFVAWVCCHLNMHNDEHLIMSIAWRFLTLWALFNLCFGRCQSIVRCQSVQIQIPAMPRTKDKSGQAFSNRKLSECKTCAKNWMHFAAIDAMFCPFSIPNSNVLQLNETVFKYCHKITQVCFSFCSFSKPPSCNLVFKRDSEGDRERCRL